ncbi:MAG: sialate O-acetylesterase [bacterium]|nr:sialate O-acetylesterase [bacterium]
MALAGCLAAALATPATWANVKLNALFNDNAVLQRGEAIPVWGWADPGEKITVQIDRQKASTKADQDGKWMVKLKSMKEGGPYELKVAGNNEITLKNIMIGEVWVCSGQSNMQWRVGDVNNAEYEVAHAWYPNIRLFYVPRVAAGAPQDNVNASWDVCSPDTIPNFSAVAYFFGRELNERLNVPIGLIHTSWGGTPAESWTSEEFLSGNPELEHYTANEREQLAKVDQTYADFQKKFADWVERAKAAEAHGEVVPEAPGVPGDYRRNPWRPTSLYNAMIAPLIPCAFRGAIWYQGESNADRAIEYRTLFPEMIKSWRANWDQGDFPFYFVQLANFNANGKWPELREAQTMTLSLPHTGMAVIIDIGDPYDIHPRNKQEVGRRLALNALAQDYGYDLEYSGPMYKSMSKDGSSIVLSFDHAESGLVAGPRMDEAYVRRASRNGGGDGVLRGFEIAGSDGAYHPANAEIKDGKVVVSSPEVSDPVNARYAWKDNPDEANLYNRAGLPASPFRTGE